MFIHLFEVPYKNHEPLVNYYPYPDDLLGKIQQYWKAKLIAPRTSEGNHQGTVKCAHFLRNEPYSKQII
jgi:hypothetical protein